MERELKPKGLGIFVPSQYAYDRSEKLDYHSAREASSTQVDINSRSRMRRGSLSLCLGPEFQTYWGVDISDVAISKARENLAESGKNSTFDYHLEVSQIQDFRPSRKFDIIVFNEVLYYLSMDQVAAAIRRYTEFLSPGGVILISMKDHELCRCVQAVVMQELKFEYGVLYQQQPECPGWKIYRNRQTPAYLVQVFRPMK